MAFEPKPNTGALFKNERKTKTTQPDYQGNVNIDGVEYKLSGWIREMKDKGTKYLSLSVAPKDARYGTSNSRRDDDDGPPF